MAANVSRGILKPIKIMDAVSVNGIGSVIDVRDFLYIQAVIATSGSAAGTIRFPTAMVENRTDVNFANAASVTNQWDYMAFYNLQNPTTIIAGDTGLVYAGTDAVEQLVLNVDGVTDLTCQLSGHSAGAFTVTLIGFSNQ